MFTFFLLVFGEIQEQDLIAHPNKSKYFRLQNIAASASNAKNAAMYMNTLQDLTRGLSEHGLKTNVQRVGDYQIEIFWTEDDKILVEYYKEQTPAFVVQAYLYGVRTFRGMPAKVLEKTLKHFYTLATSLQDKIQWQLPSTQGEIPNTTQTVEKARQEYEAAKAAWDKLSETEKDTPESTHTLEAHQKYILNGLQYFDDLDDNAKKAILSHVIDLKGYQTTVYLDMKKKFIPTVCAVLTDRAIKTLVLSFLDRYKHQDPSYKPLLPAYGILLKNYTGDSKIVNQQFIDVLKEKNDIQEIKISGVHINKKLISLLTGKTQIRRLTFDNCLFLEESVEELLKILLTLPDVGVGAKECRFVSEASEDAFKKALPNYPFIDILYSNKTIRMERGNYNFSDSAILDRVCVRIKQIASKNPESFSMYEQNRLTPDTLGKILEVLPESITSITIRHSHLDNTGFQFLVAWLEKRPTVRQLHLAVKDDVTQESRETLQAVVGGRKGADIRIFEMWEL